MIVPVEYVENLLKNWVTCNIKSQKKNYFDKF